MHLFYLALFPDKTSALWTINMWSSIKIVTAALRCHMSLSFNETECRNSPHDCAYYNSISGNVQMKNVNWSLQGSGPHVDRINENRTTVCPITRAVTLISCNVFYRKWRNKITMPLHLKLLKRFYIQRSGARYVSKSIPFWCFSKHTSFFNNISTTAMIFTPM